MTGDKGEEPAAGVQSPTASESIEKTTPESIGTIVRNGKFCGDSGYALEELLLGGRLRHRHIKGGAVFQVETLTLAANEPHSYQTERRLSDADVEALMGRLTAGNWADVRIGPGLAGDAELPQHPRPERPGGKSRPAPHEGAETETEAFPGEDDSDDEEDEIDGLVLFTPGPPRPGLKS